MRTNHAIRCILPIMLAFSLSVPFACSPAPEKQKNYLVGIVNPNKGTQDINRGFIEGLAESGYIEGQNTTFITAENSFELDQIIQDMVARNTDLIFTVTTPATKKAKNATKENKIPVVFAMQDPVASGLINNLAHPDGNLTGVQIRGSVPKAVEWMRAVSPLVKHFFVPIKYDTKAAKQSLEDLQATTELLGIRLTLAEVNDQLELDDALAAIPEDADAIFILHSIFIHSNIEKLVRIAVARKILIGSAAALQERGVTVCYGMIGEKTGLQASRMANLILNGTSPAEIPSEVTEFFLGVNLRTATDSGIEIPIDVLQKADFIIR